ncbi:hypothetical protein PHLGIDRAFT_115319 [Phlebiopsis gigantea 11061_1 CR5-6]|uniref:Major facilitator superfamily (MFS) profile domain-containing protein n=1 Tax=Phlebiopsis gigantea (strain 11061_1 CR5-6) TaxID=745531 RepID=A0A0C3SC32_PHLG1|nr:hypothetical protein PHLGIDRAFT_115319 [Phlebiopsis gigantea 11061_1 CR5-6]
MATLTKKDSASASSQSSESASPHPVYEAQAGVKAVEAAEKVYGRYSNLALASYIYSLDGVTTYTYLAYATSAFEEHSLLSSITVAQSIIIACGKPVMAKLADTTSRGTSYIAVLLFYVLGYIIIASAKTLGAIAAGIIFYAVGYTGLQLLTQIIIADITTLKWRGLVSALTSTPFIVNAFIGSNISASIVKHSGWRWGYGMFAILIPVSLAPLIITLFWAERKAKKLGLTSAITEFTGQTLTQRIWHFTEQLDVIGLLFLGAAVALILLPLTLSQTAKGGWHNPSMIAMIVVGCVLLFVYIGWETWFAKRPVMPTRFLKNRAFIGASWIGFFDFVSFYLTNTYLYSFIIVVKPWSLVDATYFTETQTVALTFFGICGGLIMRLTGRYKWMLVVGLCIRLLGVGLMIHSRGAQASDAEVVWTQILQGWGGGFASVATQVGAQASVPHADVAIITAVVLLWTEIGGSIGQAIAGAIWTHTMPQKLAAHLPDLPAANRTALFDSITSVTAYPRGSAVREGVIAAYDDTMKILVVAATVVSVVPVLFALFMPDYHLGDAQNAVDGATLTGEPVDSAPVADSEAQTAERR